MKESNIERYLRNQLKKIGGTSHKWVSPGHNGVPDQICIYNGYICFVETKFHNDNLSPAQVREIKRLRSHGADVYILKTFHEVDQFILEILKNA